MKRRKVDVLAETMPGSALSFVEDQLPEVSCWINGKSVQAHDIVVLKVMELQHMSGAALSYPRPVFC